MDSTGDNQSFEFDSSIARSSSTLSSLLDTDAANFDHGLKDHKPVVAGLKMLMLNGLRKHHRVKDWLKHAGREKKLPGMYSMICPYFTAGVILRYGTLSYQA